MKQTNEARQASEIALPSEHFEAPQGDAVSLKRREAMLRIARKVSYAAPATLALLSVKASACSLTC
jgi:hypothetical protein